MASNAKLYGIALVSSLALLSAPAFAQSYSSTPATHAADAASTANPLRMEDVTQLKGVDVVGSDSKKIGSISAVLMSPSSHVVDRLVVDEGSVLGIGGHEVALPISQFKWDSQNREFTVATTADAVKSMPAWQRPQEAQAPSSSAPSRDASAPRNSSDIPASQAPTH